MSAPMSIADLQALACADCPAAVTVQRGQSLTGPQLVVFVVHADTCPWSIAHVPVGGATLIKLGGMLRHVRASDQDVPDDPRGRAVASEGTGP